jgi:hypothetical protein
MAEVFPRQRVVNKTCDIQEMIPGQATRFHPETALFRHGGVNLQA